MDIAAPYKTCRPGSMSAVPLKADMHRHDGDVRFVPIVLKKSAAQLFGMLQGIRRA